MKIHEEKTKDTEASLLVKALAELESSDTSETLKINEYNNSFIFGPIIDRILAVICLALSALCIWSLFIANIQSVVLIFDGLGAFFFGWMGLISISEKCRAFGFGLMKAIGYFVLLISGIYLLSIFPVSVAIILGSAIIGFFIYNGLKKKHDAD